ncbi:energy transducer TonB [Aurantiacibacter sp. MUD11]|uniref:energy transducer TonB n=1 Tax=Aurantiacibacter sp. MUD11 TaxID=3003265 RepID=UPI0022AAF253|nr:energy transducer TonB [Aurantiacibacter sp. MUD11]WAT18670.1 energy transducer TonB [Aurantiacibacter sp. MUD11]
MSLIRLGFVGVIAGALLTSPAQAETPLEYFDPASNWVMDYGEDSCALRRAYADAEGRTVYVDMRQVAPGTWLTFTVFSEDLERMPEEVRYRFEPDDENSDVGFAFALDFGETARGFRFSGDYLRKEERPDDWEDYQNVDPSILAAREAEVSAMVILEGFEDSILLRTGSLTGPMQAMRACLDDLMSGLGVDPEVQRTLSRRAEPVNDISISQNLGADFPRAMIRDRQSATMQVRLVVGPDGRVSDCSIIGIVGPPDYGEAACGSFSRYARFEPALDADGNPVATLWNTDLSYWTR